MTETSAQQETARIHPHRTRVAFSCFVFTTDGRVLFTMRGQTQRTWPGVWTSSCYGHPFDGEPPEEAVARALADELGLPSVTAEPVLPDFRYRIAGEAADELCPVYRVVTDDPPRPDPGAVGDFEWVPWPDFAYAVVTGDITVPPWCRLQVAELSQIGDDPVRWPAYRAMPPAA